jgi:predicted amidohydrolase YtcJ
MRKIYTNGSFYTFNRIQPIVQSVVIENGYVVDMGDSYQMLSFWKDKETEIIDLQGKTVTPGLTDSHLHLSMVADSFVTLDLTGVTTKQEMLERIRKKAQKLAPNEWIVGGNWDENLFTDGTIPTISELDYVAPGNPLLLSRICRHAAVTNSKALEISNYHPSITVPEGGTIVLDDITKRPTGLLLETASQLISRHIPERSYDDWLKAMRETIQFAVKQGLTSAHTNDPLYMGGLEQTYQIYDQLLNKEQLGLRTNLLINYNFLDELRERGMFAGYGNDTLQIGAIKLFADGAFGRRTALLSEPYADDPTNYGEAMFDEAGLTHIVKRARALDFPVAVHTIGDQALENVLNVLDKFPSVSYRDRIIHVQVLRNELIERLHHPSRIVDIQPRFLASDFPWVEERLGKDRMNKSYAWKSLLDAGVICAGGSDAPVEPVNPLLGIHAAVTRKSPGDNHDGYNQNEKLTMTEAFQLFTEFGAYPTNEETKKGTIARGKLADMVVFSSNPFEMEDPDELLHTEVEMTIIGGEIKYQK